MATDKNVEKHISRGTLEKLLKSNARCASTIGDARQAFGEELSKATNRGLNKFAFGVVKKLYNQDPAKAAQNIRAIMHYVELLGLDAQSDLEDVIDDGNDEVEEANGTSDEEWNAAAPDEASEEVPEEATQH